MALARALAPEPRLLLLDEPLSNLDPSLRERTRRELRRTLARVGITTVLVTHEQEEAFHLGDRVAVLGGGRLHQVGTPEELYERPATRFVAGFVGRASALAGTYAGRDGGAGRVRIAAGDSEVGRQGRRRPRAWRRATRSKSCRAAESGAAAPRGFEGSLPGRVVERRYAGQGTYYTVGLDGGAELEVLAEAHAAAAGEPVRVGPRAGASLPRIFPREAPG